MTQYLCILFTIIILLLVAYLCFIHRALRRAARDMEQIEEQPEQNRQLKSVYGLRSLEQVLQRINILYTARQEERIHYQRRELQIRQEVENISHDLRTPLTSILGYLDLLQDEDTSLKEREEYLEIIRKRAKVLQGFIQDFYEISRIEADDYPLLLTSLPVQGTVKEAIVSYYLDFERRNIQVEVSMEDTPCYIIADKIQFDRILNNLIQNALKYANKKFILRQSITKNYCRLQFINDTEGLTEDELSKIFERFYTGDQSRNNQSTGLGLTITKALTQKMKGQIEAKIERNQFILELTWPIK